MNKIFKKYKTGTLPVLTLRWLVIYISIGMVRILKIDFKNLNYEKIPLRENTVWKNHEPIASATW